MQTVDLQQAGQTLKDLIERHGWSLRAFARRAKVSDTTIRYYVNGGRTDGQHWNPTKPGVRKIADAFGLPIGITILEMYGFDDMVEAFRADHESNTSSIEERLDAVSEEVASLREAVDRILAELVGSNDAKPGYISPAGVAPVITLPIWVDRPMQGAMPASSVA